jgi:phage head maturation protease
MTEAIRADPTGIRALPSGGFRSLHPANDTLTVDAKRMLVRSVITTIDADRAGDVVVPMGLKNAEEYLLNPVVLWAHNRSQFPPIGTCAWLDPQPRRVVAETHFAQRVQFAEDVFRLYEQGVLRGWSIGFVPRKAYRMPTSVVQRAHYPADNFALRVEEWDLMEYSAVPIPENPGALTVALQKGMVRDPKFRDWLWQLPDDRGGRFHRAGDVLAALVRPAPTSNEDVLCSE